MLDLKEEVEAALIVKMYELFFTHFAKRCTDQNIDYEIKTEIIRRGRTDLKIEGDKYGLKVYYKED